MSFKDLNYGDLDTLNALLGHDGKPAYSLIRGFVFFDLSEFKNGYSKFDTAWAELGESTQQAIVDIWPIGKGFDYCYYFYTEYEEMEQPQLPETITTDNFVDVFKTAMNGMMRYEREKNWLKSNNQVERISCHLYLKFKKEVDQLMAER